MKLEHLRKLLGEEWIEREVLCPQPRHPLGRWHKKSVDNPVARYADELAEFFLNSGVVAYDSARLATKLSGEFMETLLEMDFAVFLGRQGFRVTTEPTAPAAGPDLLVEQQNKYFVEMRRVGLDETRASADAATEDVFNRLCTMPSRHSVMISMTDNYSAYSPQLKKAVRLVRSVLSELEKRRVRRATLYYHGPDDYTLREGEERQPNFDYSDGQRLAAQIREMERARDAHFVASFDDTGQKNARTAVGVLPLGSHPHFVQPDQTHLRLRSILGKKRDQLPKGSRGIIVLEVSDLAKIMVDQYTFMAALYGDLQVTLRAAPEGNREAFEVNSSRKPNGFFLATSRVSAVVIERENIVGRFSVDREVYPTNNPQASVLTLPELGCFGEVVQGLENLCAEQLRK